MITYDSTTKKLAKDFDHVGDAAKDLAKNQRDLKQAHKNLHSSLMEQGKSLAKGKFSEAHGG